MEIGDIIHRKRGDFNWLQYPDVDELKDSLAAKMDSVADVLETYFEDRASLELIQHSWEGVDYLNQLVSTLNTMSEPTQEEIYIWCDEGEKRCKYSDLILWKEILKYAKNQQTNIIFVTDDVKTDWWDDTGFHPKLLAEFSKTGQAVIPMTCMEFLADVVESHNITKTDAVEIALRMTDSDYCIKIEDKVFDEASEELFYDAIKYINIKTANIGTEGIDEFEITDHEFITAHRVNRYNDTVIYEFTYKVTLKGTSYDYWGRDEDTREVIRSDGRDYVFEGEIVVEVRREAEPFYDFEDDDSFETAIIIRGKLEETEFYDRQENDFEPPGELGYCPDCGCPLNIENDDGNGFCIKCAPEHY